MNPTSLTTKRTEANTGAGVSGAFPESEMAKFWNRFKVPIISFLIWGLSAAVYYPLVHHQFINFDDQDYITQNEMVQMGCTWKSFRWAFTTQFAGNWHPLTWLSHMVDYQFYRMDAGGHHLTNLLLHATNAVLVFILLRRLTGTLWRSAFVAVVFAVHPLHVESVAWASERKDVLSIFFGLLSICAYTACVARNSAGSVAGTLWKNRVWYLAAVAFFALSLMSKAMLVTLPFLLLLLDYWPLNREGWNGIKAINRKVLWDKIPFLALSVLSCIVTMSAQKHAGAVATMTAYPMTQRIPNVIYAYAEYLKKMLWPADLSVFYPMNLARPLGMILLDGALLSLITAGVYCLRRASRYLIVGWLWYLGTLVPVIGIIHVGEQSMADRYTYFPLIGIFIMGAWAGFHLLGGSAPGRSVLLVLAGLMIGGCVIVTSHQLRYWTDSTSLFEHALKVTSGNYIAHQSIGSVLVEQGKIKEATDHFREAVRMKPRFAEAESDLGLALVFQGKTEEGIEHYRKALQTKPNLQKTHYNLGRALESQNKLEEACQEYQEAVALDGQYLAAREALALALTRQEKYAEAIDQFLALTNLNPQDANAHFNLARCFEKLGKDSDAKIHLSAVVALTPSDAEAREQLGMLLAKGNELEEAINQFTQALEIKPTASAHYEIALAQVMRGDRAKASAHYREAIRLKPDWPLPMNDLAWILATAPERELRNGEEAIKLAERACALGKEEARFYGTLDAAYAEAGRFADALQAAGRAKSLAIASGQKEVLTAAEKRMELYRHSTPFRQ
jgi:tetratricopeptide (TPR) repeat protein